MSDVFRSMLLAGAGVILVSSSSGPAAAGPRKSEAKISVGEKKHPTTGAAQRAEVGAPAPNFTLTDTEGNEHELSDYVEAGKTVVLEWFNPDCPFVQKHHKKSRAMAETFAKYENEGVVWLAVNSGAPGKQGHGIERNRKAREQYKMEYPVLLDEDGLVGRRYGAKTTPHMFVIQGGNLVYRGAIDDNRSVDKLGGTNYVTSALDAVFGGGPVEVAQTKPYGCTVKYGVKAIP